MTEVCQIPLTKGKVALVDAADYERVAAHEWYAVCVKGRWYATRWQRSPLRIVKLHRFLLEAPPRVHVGFVNGDSLDCRRSNLRLRKGAGFYKWAPQGERFPRETLPVVEAKKPVRRRYLGVIDRRNGTFGAQISEKGKCRWLGTFATERDAALAVNVAARLLRGQGDRPRACADPNDVPAAVPLDELEAAIRDLAGVTS